MNEHCIYIDINLTTILLDLGIHCFGPMEGTNTEFGSRETFSNPLPDALFITCYKQDFNHGGGVGGLEGIPEKLSINVY